MAEKLNLISKLVSVMGAVESIPKNGYNDFHKYKYATEADVADTVRKELVKHNILMTMNVIQAEQIKEDIVRLKTEYTFHDADSGDKLMFVMFSDGQDKNDKGAYKAMTGGEKYAIMKTFLIPTHDDPESSNGKGKGKKETKRKQTKSSGPPDGFEESPPGDKEPPPLPLSSHESPPLPWEQESDKAPPALIDSPTVVKVRTALNKKSIPEDELLKNFNIKELSKLTVDKLDEARDWVRDYR